MRGSMRLVCRNSVSSVVKRATSSEYAKFWEERAGFRRLKETF